MNLIRWSPYRELEQVSNRLNKLFGTEFPELGALSSFPEAEKMKLNVWTPMVDVKESDEEYLIKAEIPEVKKEDVKVLVKDHQLTLQGERREEKEEKGKRFHRIERSYGSFMRSFTLPDDVDEGKLRADFRDGMLYLHLPKSAVVKEQTKEIKIS